MTFDVDRLKALATASPFKGWAGFVAPHKLDACRRIMREAARRLVDAPGSSKPERVAILRVAIHHLNDLDDGFITTIEREDLCDHLAAIGAAAGLSASEVDNALDDRDW